MNILVVGGKNSYAVKRLQGEAEKRGHFLDAVSSKDLVLNLSPKKISVKILHKELLMKDYDLLFTYTINPRRKFDWIIALRYLRQKYPHLKIVYEKYSKKKEAFFFTQVWDYYLQHKEGLPFPKSIVFYDTAGLKRALHIIEPPAILKVNAPKLARQGKGVFLINSFKEGKKIIKEYQATANRFVLREFIPNEGDIRFFTVGYKVIASMRRIPKEGEFRSNLAQGGKALSFDFHKHPKLTKLAETAVRLLKLEIAGVDIMLHKETKRPYILEINPGPQFAGLEKATGINVAEAIIRYFESLVK